MPFRGPDKERLLHKVARVGRILRQTKSKSVERCVVRIDQLREYFGTHAGFQSCFALDLFPETSGRATCFVSICLLI